MQVKESMRVAASGGGVAEDGEQIEVLALPVDFAMEFLLDSTIAKSSGMMFAVMWLRDWLQQQNI